MKFRQCFVLTFLPLLCVECVHGGALLKDYKSKKEASIEAKQNTDASSNESNNTDGNTGVAVDNVASASNQQVDSEKTNNKKIVGDPVVLRIGRKEFKRSHILADLKLIPPQLIKGVPSDKLFGMLVDQKMSTYLMVEQAKKAGMDKTKDFVEKVERMKDELLARTFLIKEIAPKADNESTLKARYTKYLVEFKKGKEHQVWHIVVATEEEAKAIVEQLNKGADFAQLAKEKSIAPSKEKDGDEGYIPLNLLPQNISEKLLALKKGEYTKDAIKINNEFHIFKIGDSRDTSPQKFEEIKEGLKQMVVQEEIMKMIDRLEKQYNVEKFNEDGSPIVKKS